jgi:hypothetical protein
VELVQESSGCGRFLIGPFPKLPKCCSFSSHEVLLNFSKGLLFEEFSQRASFKLHYTSLPVPKGSVAVFLQEAVVRNRALSFFQDERTS